MIEDGDRGLRAYMLGTFELYYNGEVLHLKKKGSAKPVQLLQLLLQNRRTGISRAAAMEALYGRNAKVDAANNLNATASQLRRLLRESALPPGDHVRAEIDRYYFDAPFPVWVDAEEAVRLRRRADQLEPERRGELLQELCGLFRGRFLPGLDGEEWVERARAGYQQIFRRSMDELCTSLMERGAYAEAERLSGRAAALFPFEGWQAWQMECLMAQGRVEDARELYRQVEELYRRERGAPPPERMAALLPRGGSGAGRGPEAAPGPREQMPVAGRDGPCRLPFPSFLDAYGLIARMSAAAGQSVCLLLCTLLLGDGARTPQEPERLRDGMDCLESALVQTLRGEDTFTRYSRAQFLSILIGAREEDGEAVSRRIGEKFRELCGDDRLRVEHQVMPADLK